MLFGIRSFLVFIALASASFFLAIAYLQRDLPDVSQLKNHYPLVEFRSQDETAKISLVKKRPPDWVSLEKISPFAIGAFVVSEDWSFFEHEGFDFDEFLKMLEETLEDAHSLRGASTITQQVAKNVFLYPQRSLIRKAKEVLLTQELEKHFSKNQILEIYFNIVELGSGLYGIGPASRFYFQKPPLDLTPREAAFLAMLLPSPKKYSYSFHSRELTPYAKKTVRSILRKMHTAKYITDEELQDQLERPLSFEP